MVFLILFSLPIRYPMHNSGYSYDGFRRATESIPTIRHEFCWQDESHLSIRGCAAMMPMYALDANDTRSHPVTGKELAAETELDFFIEGGSIPWADAYSTVP
jgi:hypothetical protein